MITLSFLHGTYYLLILDMKIADLVIGYVLIIPCNRVISRWAELRWFGIPVIEGVGVSPFE